MTPEQLQAMRRCSLTGCGKTRRKTISTKSKHYYDHESVSWINVVRGQKHFFRNLLKAHQADQQYQQTGHDPAGSATPGCFLLGLFQWRRACARWRTANARNTARTANAGNTAEDNHQLQSYRRRWVKLFVVVNRLLASGRLSMRFRLSSSGTY